MKKVLPNNSKTEKYLAKLPKIYLVGCWARYGVMEFPFSGKYIINENGISIPLVYDYDDFNGTSDNWYLRPINLTTTGFIIVWTQCESVAERIAELYNKELKC